MNTMNKLLSLMTLVVLVGIAGGCRKQELQTAGDEPFRVLLPVDAPAVAFPNRPLAFDVDVYAEKGIERVEVRQNFQVVPGSEMLFADKPTAAVYPFRLLVDRTALGRVYNFVIVVHGADGHTATAGYQVSIQEAPVHISVPLPEDLPAEAVFGDEIRFSTRIVTEMPFKSIRSYVNDVEIEALAVYDFPDPVTDEYTFSYEIGEEDIGETLNFRISVTDEEEKVFHAPFTVVVGGVRPPRPVKVYNDFVLGAQLNTDFGHFLNTKAATAHFSPGIAPISAGIDLLTFFSGSTGVNMTAPSFANAPIVYSVAHSNATDALAAWPVRNNTALIRLSGVTESQFGTIATDHDIIALFDAGGATTDNVNRIAVGDVIVFRTAAGGYGILRVKSLPGNNRSTITFDLKMQP
jgi:hypothetical protein